MSVTRINHFEAQWNSAERLHLFMQGVVAKVKTLPGCRSVRLLRSSENPAHLAITVQDFHHTVHRAAHFFFCVHAKPSR